MKSEIREGEGSRRKERPERKVAWVFIVLGVLILLAWLIYRFISRLQTITISVSSVSFGLIITGGLILFISVLVERIREKRTDRYRDIEK